MSEGKPQARVQWKQPQNIRDLIMQALSNVNNSFAGVDMESRVIPGLGPQTMTHPSEKRYAGNVMILKNHILKEIQDDTYQKAVKGKTAIEDPELFHLEIMELLNRQGMFNLVVLRSFAK